MGGAGQTSGRPLLERREKWRTPQLFRSTLNRQPGLYSAEMWASRQCCFVAADLIEFGSGTYSAPLKCRTRHFHWLSSLEAQHRNLLPICPHRSVLKSFAGQISSSPEFSV
jgi:hypothetical protein